MTLRAFLIVLATALVVSSCGGGGSTTAGGIGGTGVSYGPVTGFGSVIVNGVEYETDASTSYTVEDVNDTEDAIDVGMMVTVIHDDTDNAISVTYQDNVEGPIATGSIDAGAGSFEVLGITVQTDALTFFDGTTDLTTLNDGDFVEVSGYLVAGSTVQATRVELKPAGDCTEIEVKGTVANHIPGAGGGSFMIGSLTVNYDGSTAIDDSLSGLSSFNDLYVEVKSDACPDGSNAITATEIESENEGAEDENGNEIEDEDADIELKGIIATLTGSGDNRSFTVNGQVVNTSVDTIYEAGDVNTLADGVTVEVEGTLDSAGELQASNIGFEDEEGETIDEVTGIPTAVSVDSYNTGTITLGGVDYLTYLTTIFASEVTADFNLSSIVPDTTCIEIDAYDDGTGNMIAVKIEEDDGCAM